MLQILAAVHLVQRKTHNLLWYKSPQRSHMVDVQQTKLSKGKVTLLYTGQLQPHQGTVKLFMR